MSPEQKIILKVAAIFFMAVGGLFIMIGIF